VALFMSTHVNKVDRKGRVSVPATFRATLSGQPFAGVVVFPSFEQEALEGAGMDRMEAIAAGLDRLGQPKEQQRLANLILARSQPMPFDPEGRITLPERCLAHAHIADTAIFVGLGSTFQIWEPDRFAAQEAAWIELARREGTELPTLGSLAARMVQ
jgi:MraZ protein